MTILDCALILKIVLSNVMKNSWMVIWMVEIK